MEYLYEAITTESGAEVIKRTDADGNEAWIPTDPSNSDYAAYCVWAVAEGIMEAPVVVEPEDTEPVTEPEPDTE